MIKQACPTLFFLAASAIGGCAHETAMPDRQPRADYSIGREDVLTVEVWKEPTLSTKVPVRPDGKISLPMLGDVQAEGRTTRELTHELTEMLKPFVEQPVVSVMVTEVNAAKFFVLGEVAHPGAFPVRGEISVIQALAMAGGPTEFANQRQVVVIRPQRNGTEARYRVNCRDVLAGHARAIRVPPATRSTFPEVVNRSSCFFDALAPAGCQAPSPPASQLGPSPLHCCCCASTSLARPRHRRPTSRSRARWIAPTTATSTTGADPTS